MAGEKVERKRDGHGRYAAASAEEREQRAEDDKRIAEEKRAGMAVVRPKYCRQYARRKAAERWPEIIDKMVEMAAKGSYNHFKGLILVGGFDEPAVKGARKKRRGQTLVEYLKAEMARRKALEAEEAAETKQD